MNLFPFPSRPLPPRYRLASRWGLLAVFLLGACTETSPAPRGNGTALEDGLILKREIRAEESHTYPVVLEEGQFLRVIVDQNGVDVVVRLLDPDGTEVFAVDSPNGWDGDEDFAAVARRSGPHRIEISTSSERGGYALKVEGPRLPTERDRLRVEAVRATREALFPKEGKSAEDRVARFEKALGLWEKLGEPRRQAEMLYLLGSLLSDLGKVEQAAALWGRLGDRGMGDLRLRVEALNDAGILLEKLARRKDAQARFEEALELATKEKNLGQQAAMLHNLGRLARKRGDAREGIKLLQRSIELARKIGDKKLQAPALNTLGVAFMDLSDRQQALSSYKEALKLSREIEDRKTEGSALTNLGDAYQSLGDWDKALEFHNESLPIHRELKNRIDEATALNNLGAVYQRLGQTDQAIKLYLQAYVIVRETGDKDLQARFLINLGFVHLLRGDGDKAREACLQALELVGDRGDIEASARHALGSAYRLLEDYEAARRQLAEALALSREQGNRSREADVMLTLARLEKDRGDLAAALSLVEESVTIVESLRTAVVSQDLRASFLAAKQAHYELQIDVLMALHAADPGKGHAAEALRVSEQARARGLLEILQEGGADIRQGAAPELLERESRLRAELNAQELQRLALRGDKTATPERRAEAERKLKEALDSYQQVQEELRKSSPRYAALIQPRPLEVAEIQTEVLGGGALLLEYALGAERSYLWAVTPTSVESFTLPARDRIENLARQYYGLLTARNQPVGQETVVQTRERLNRMDTEAGQAAAELSKMVLGPVRYLLKGQPLLVVSDGALQYIPFSALPVPTTTTPLIQKHRVVNLPSASALAVLRDEVRDRPAAPRTLAVLADPVFQKNDPRLAKLQQSSKDVVARSSTHRGAVSLFGLEREGEVDLESFWRLRFSGIEADAIAALLPPDQTFKAVGFDASRATAISGRLAEYRNVHFATHGVVKSDHPELSSLVLSLYDEKGESVDGFLRLNDVYNLELRADLVVLSACRTALGKEIRGEGLIGLTRGFMYAGTPRVLATLWSVDDGATADFMEHFYRAMLNKKLSPAAALREAQLAMMASNRKAPYYWAGFSLQGEWK